MLTNHDFYDFQLNNMFFFTWFFILCGLDCDQAMVETCKV